MRRILALDEVAQGSAVGSFEAKIMIAVEELPEQMALLRRLNAAQLQRNKAGERSTEQWLRIAERSISNGKLNALLRFHIRPINVVVFHGPS